MAATKRVRWECPTGAHAGVLGPTRPRRENICRYCLDCSKAEGKLVERVAPAVERQRATQAERTTAKAKERAARAKAKEDAYYTVAGVDLRVELKRFSRLKAFRGKKGRLYRRPPELIVTRRKYVPSRYGAASEWENKIWISDYKGITKADVLETLLHECVHVVVGGCSGKACHHGYEFHAKMREAFDEAFPKAKRWGPLNNSYHGYYTRVLRDSWRTVEELRAHAEKMRQISEGADDPKWWSDYAAHLDELADSRSA